MTKSNSHMNSKFQTKVTPAAIQRRGFRGASRSDELFTLQQEGGRAAEYEWESSASYEEQLAELLSIFVPQDSFPVAPRSY